MKKTFFKLIGRTTFVAFALTASVFMISSARSFAAVTTKTFIVDSAAASVDYIKTIDNSQYFQVKILNAQNKIFTLTISNQSGDVFFKKEYNEQSFDKMIKMLPDENFNTSNYRFTVSWGKQYQDLNFNVNTVTTSFDKVTVTELD